MTINDSRSLNEQLKRGATDGRVRNMRPDAAGAEYEHARERARLLHPVNYGTFGQDGDNASPTIEAAMPDAAVRNMRRSSGWNGY